jgi:phasin family protein
LAAVELNLQSVLEQAHEHFGSENKSLEFQALKKRITALDSRRAHLKKLLESETTSELMVSSQTASTSPGSLSDTTVVMINAAATSIASHFGAALRDRVGAHVIDVPLESDSLLAVLETMQMITAQTQEGITGVAVIVDSGQFEKAEQVAVQLSMLATAIPANVAPVVFDVGYESEFRNTVLKQHWVYAGDAARLAPDAMLNVFNIQPHGSVQAVVGRQTSFDMDIGKAFAGFQIPGFDVDSLVESQRKNLEAFTHANQLAVEGVQAIARRNVELIRQAVEEASAALKGLTQPGAPEERFAKNAELAKQAFDRGIANAREIVEMMAKANAEAFSLMQKHVNVIQKRVNAGLAEIRDHAKHSKR